MSKKKTQAVIVESVSIERSLQQIANCLAYLVIHTGDLKEKPDKDVITTLTSFGFDRGVIAAVLQTTPESVSVQLSQQKAKSRTKQSSQAA